MRAARAQIAAAELPIQQQIQAERAANLKKAQQQMGFAKAASALLTGIAPRVQDTYSNAANADAGYARGLGNNVQADVNQRSAADNAFLKSMGTPSAGLEHPADVGGTTYGLEGYIPATTLQREGAAFGSAAQMLPQQALRQGEQQAGATLANDPTLTGLQGDLAKLAATQPAVYQQVLSSLQDQMYKQAELKLSAGRLNLSRQSLASENAYRNASLNLRAQSLNQTAFNENRSYQLSLKRLGISQRSLQLRATAQEARLHGGSAKHPAFTPNEIVGLKRYAASAAQAMHDGIPKTSTRAAVPPVTSYKAAFKKMILHGVPPSIAVMELKGAGYKLPVKVNFSPTILPKVDMKIVDMAHQYLGTPYVYGGESPKGFDCSGFAQYLYSHVGIGIPRTTYTQWTARNGRSVGKSQLQPGDLVFFRGSDSKGGLPGHVGVYIGHGMMIDAPHTGADVRMESVAKFPGYMGARRYH